MGAYQFKIGQRVALIGREEDIRTVAAMYRVEIWNYYELTGMHEFLVRESRIVAKETGDAPGFVPCPMAQSCGDRK